MNCFGCLIRVRLRKRPLKLDLSILAEQQSHWHTELLVVASLGKFGNVLRKQEWEIEAYNILPHGT